MTDEAAVFHQRLLDDLTASGKLTLPWRAAFAAVARHRFIPDTIWDDSGGELVPLRRAEDPDRWLDAAYALDDPRTRTRFTIALLSGAPPDLSADAGAEPDPELPA